MSELDDSLIGEIEITKNDLYKDGGIVYFYHSDCDWAPFFHTRVGDGRAGSFELERYLRGKIHECVVSGVIEKNYGSNLYSCEAAFVDLVNEVFKTDFIYWPREIQEKTVIHPSFGEVRIKDYTYDDDDYPDGAKF